MYQTKEQAATFVYNEKQEVVALIIRDELTGHNLVYSCSEMSIEDIAQLINQKL